MTLSKFYVLYNLIPIFTLTLKQSFNKLEKHVSNMFVVNVSSTLFFYNISFAFWLFNCISSNEKEVFFLKLL